MMDASKDEFYSWEQSKQKEYLMRTQELLKQYERDLSDPKIDPEEQIQN